MEDPRRYLGLHTVAMLRELIRKWWQVEVGFADQSGQLLDDSWGRDLAAGSDFCRAAQASAEGRRRCLKSVREIHLRLRGQVRDPGPLLHSCHLGLAMAACSVVSREEQRGTFFACGFSSREFSHTRIGRLRGSMREFLPREVVLDGDRIPILSREDIERLLDLLAYGASEMAAFEEEVTRRESAEPRPTDTVFEGVVDHSRPMAAAVARLKQLAPLSRPLVLLGEDGTGKRALARAVHQGSPRRHGPFVVFEGSSDSLASETALFGQSPDGSLVRPGVLEGADNGTLYLSAGSWQVAPVQVKLLRYLQEGTIVPIGTNRVLHTDVRLVLGLEGDMDLEVAEGSLRRDLYDLLHPYRVEVPPLRQRLEDLADLVEMFLRRHCSSEQPLPALHPDAREILQRYEWPGNVGELESEIRRMLSFPLHHGQLSAAGISGRVRQSVEGTSPVFSQAAKGNLHLRQAVCLLERELIQQGLLRTQWNKSMLARQLGVSRSTLLAKLAQYGLEEPSLGEDRSR